ncbi:DDE transposase [Streptococcus pneumoniae]|uniref:DDE transposase n=1 Tax=Streptococcus pneumoniae TaxID=1313 RepID=UPI00077A70DC
MKAQAIVTSQGRIVSLDIAVNYSHDMKLFKMSRRNIELMKKLRLILVFTKATLSVGANGLK